VQDSHLDRFQYSEEGASLLDLLTKKYGGAAAASHFDAHHKRLTQAGAKVGIAFNTPWVDRVVKSIDSHRLIEWCKEVAPDRTDELVHGLLKAYFIDGMQLNNHDHLISVAESCNLDGAAEMLSSDRFRREVKTKVDDWGRKGVSGVPFFLVHPASGKGQPTVFSGAQPIELMSEVLQEQAQL